jgi:molybdate transport system substrate-binding protein
MTPLSYRIVPRIPITLLLSLLLTFLWVTAGQGHASGQAPGHGSGGAQAKATVIAAASDLKFALEEVSKAFTKDTGARVELVFSSSGTLTRQLIDGAPFELFMSADEDFVFKLADAGLTKDRGALYATGRLVLFAPHGSPLKVDEQLNGLRALLASGGGSKRFAIANPAHAPYGRAAERVLRAKGLWDAVKPSLVLGENISQAAQFAATGNAVGGMIALSLMLAPPFRAAGTYVVLPDRDHPPLRQRMVLMKRAGPTAAKFYDYIQQPAARDIMRRYGFVVPTAR